MKTDAFEILMRKAESTLNDHSTGDSLTTERAKAEMLRGIGYALMALALAIKEKNEKEGDT